MLTRLIERVGNAIPGDDVEYLTCPDDETHLRVTWNDDAPNDCPVCGAEVVVHLPRGWRWCINYMCWRDRYFPHRIYTPRQRGVPQATGKWVWRSRTLYKWERNDPFDLDLFANLDKKGGEDESDAERS
jgi:hypothetical protein